MTILHLASTSVFACLPACSICVVPSKLENILKEIDQASVSTGTLYTTNNPITSTYNELTVLLLRLRNRGGT